MSRLNVTSRAAAAGAGAVVREHAPTAATIAVAANARFKRTNNCSCGFKGSREDGCPGSGTREEGRRKPAGPLDFADPIGSARRPLPLEVDGKVETNEPGRGHR